MAWPNLWFALNLGHLGITGEDLSETLSLSANRTGVILISAPEFDMLGRAYDIHGPIHSSKVDLSPLRDYNHLPHVLDADYASH